jgi:hypothetical protein
MRFNDISIVGLGGIGSILSNTISRFISNDARENDPRQIINLIDGDYYEEKNLVRQEFLRFGNKAESKLNELRPKFNNIEFKDYPYFIDDITISRIIKDKDLVFLAVDNHKTRKLVSDYAKKLNDIIIISGGNEPEIRNPIDKLPNEMSCEELQNSEPQLYFTNLGVATFMAFAFYNVLKGSNNFSEVYFDMNTMKADSKTRNLKKEKGE